jgi:microcystin-dependent protein
MSDQFLGEIRLVGFSFAPQGWAFCNGQLLAIQQNTTLFSLLGTNYGGDGRTTFGLPNLQGSVAMFYGQSAGGSQYVIGESDGTPTVTLTGQQLPQHAHGFDAFTGRGPSAHPIPAAGDALTASGAADAYAPGSSGTNTQMNPAGMGLIGGSQAHENMMPSLGLYYIIAMQGIYPSRS